MAFGRTTARLAVAFGTASLLAGATGLVMAQAPPAGAPAAAQGGRGGRGAVAPGLFTAADANKDGTLTRDEMKATFDKWFTAADTAQGGTLTQEQLSAALATALPQPAAPPAPAGQG